MPDFEEIEDVDEEPSVPSELLELHIELEEQQVNPADFKEAFG